METPTSLTDRLHWQVEQLLARLASAEHSQAQLARQLQTLTEERDALQARLDTARERVDALIERLPAIQNALEGGR
ncbi:DUF904 domain-containing protein [Allofranklinella schreckenbergeri]|uniref:DUF904 domain-containing protein n=1 Tax=Allofranklinella schreckenbergeri TaxID=1076744 RepID=A0A3M6QW99_9BURK|nr:DUF904 domain-containing protein [Allofranklinella schreckenbergeri]RMX00618.1 DUF904 domain-containing protein [Allofranklinella schreckenbergeri]RMX01003.1 DUF904 domain-containing protein [Allofranklinella schreckenbergeri]RMX07277.1 DUF904 domain-containing protein [Allofranklinella schreckenbergeri]RRD44454.1 DUF904 domain-containing protein [Comamonadaceae bacterium OH3737_COT-264]